MITMTRSASGCSDVFEQTVAPASERGKPAHHAVHDVGTCVDRRSSRPRAPERTFGILCRAAQHRGVRRKAARDARDQSSGSATADRHRQCSILATSCDVRKPSKKCRNGTRGSSVAACAMAAKSWASWTDPEHSMAKPVCRHSHDVGVIAEDRERVGGHRARRNVHGERRQLPAILNMLGIISSRPCEAVNVVVSGPPAARRAPRRGTGLRLHLDDSGTSPQMFFSRWLDHSSGQLAHGRRRRDGIDGDDFVEAVGDRRRRFVAINGNHPWRTLHWEWLRERTGRGWRGRRERRRAAAYWGVRRSNQDAG